MPTIPRLLHFISLLLPIHSDELGLAKWKTGTMQERSTGGSLRGPIPKPFPDIFQIDFVTNITWVDNNVSKKKKRRRNVRHGKAQKFSSKETIPGRLFYDWTNRRQRIDHGPGSYECTHFYDHDGPCSLVFLPDLGMYRILKGSNTNDDQSTAISSPAFDCCLDIPNIGMPPPDWATLGNPTYNGVVYDTFSKIYTYEWVYTHVTASAYASFSARNASTHMCCTSKWREEQERRRPVSNLKQQSVPSIRKSNPAKDFHTTRQVVFDNGHAGWPVLFTFPSASGRLDYHYRVETMQEFDKMDTRIFELPGACLQQFCKCRDEIQLDYRTREHTEA